MTPPDHARRLVNIIKRGVTNLANAAFLWVGAGLSIPAGYPSWGQLIERLREASAELSTPDVHIQAIRQFKDVVGA